MNYGLLGQRLGISGIPVQGTRATVRGESLVLFKHTHILLGLHQDVTDVDITIVSLAAFDGTIKS